MRCIGIIGAMEVEVEKLKARMENVEITRKASMEFYAGTLEGKNVVVVRSGIGKVKYAAGIYWPDMHFSGGVSCVVRFRLRKQAVGRDSV